VQTFEAPFFVKYEKVRDQNSQGKADRMMSTPNSVMESARIESSCNQSFDRFVANNWSFAPQYDLLTCSLAAL
jgi:hypothetical protein